MKRLPPEILEKFLKGTGMHVSRQKEGLWNGIWSDMLIETTLMKKGSHSQRGLVGISLNENLSKCWALSVHTMAEMAIDFKEHTFSKEKGRSTSLKHKEEYPGRIKSDAIDRNNIRQKLTLCIDPLDHKSY